MATRVLIVEDERIVAAALQQQLERVGFDVVGNVGDAKDAIELACRVEPDVVLMDVNLGSGMDGIEASARIREQVAVPVVFLTAYADDATLARLSQTSHFGYVRKPVHERDLKPAIEMAIAHRALELEIGELRARVSELTEENRRLHQLLGQDSTRADSEG